MGSWRRGDHSAAGTCLVHIASTAPSVRLAMVGGENAASILVSGMGYEVPKLGDDCEGLLAGLECIVRGAGSVHSRSREIPKTQICGVDTEMRKIFAVKSDT